MARRSTSLQRNPQEHKPIPSDVAKIERNMTVNGYKVTLYFLPESTGEAVDTAKKLLVSSHYQDVKK